MQLRMQNYASDFSSISFNVGVLGVKLNGFILLLPLIPGKLNEGTELNDPNPPVRPDKLFPIPVLLGLFRGVGGGADPVGLIKFIFKLGI